MEGKKISLKDIAKIGLSAICVFAAGCTTSAISDEKLAELSALGLDPIEKASFDIAFIDQSAAWSTFDTVRLAELQISDAAKDAQPTTSPPGQLGFGESWIVPSEDVASLKSSYMEIFTESLSADDLFSLAGPSAAANLTIEAEILEIELTAPIEESRNSFSRIYTEGSGSMTLSIKIIEQESGNTVALFEDERSSHDTWRQNTRVRNFSEARRIMRIWARELASTLEAAKAASASVD